MIGSLFILVVVLLVYYWYKRPSNAPPGPRGLPILGMIPFMTRRPEVKFFEWSKKYGPVMSVRMGQNDWVVLNSAASIKEVLLKSGSKLTDRPPNQVLDQVLSNGKCGIVFSDGERWKRLRKFGEVTLRNLGVGKSSFEGNVLNEIGCFVENIERHIDEPYDVRKDVTNAIHRIISVVILGEKLGHGIEKAPYDFMADPYKAVLFNMAILLPFLRFIPRVGEVLHESQNLEKPSRRQYADILEDKERHPTVDDADVTTFIDAFVNEKKTENETFGHNLHFTKKQFVYYARDLVGAAQHTTTNAILWCLLGLLHYPNYQDRVRSEITKVIGKDKPFVTARHSMPFTMAYIQEIFRYCTLAPLAAPHCSTDDVNIHGYKIMKGTQVVLNIWSAHNDPDVFENPDEFRPERFLDKNANFILSKNVIPFSVGPRRCIGEQLARMEIFLFIVSILQKFRVSSDKTSDLPRLDDGILGIAYIPKSYKIVFTPL